MGKNGSKERLKSISEKPDLEKNKTCIEQQEIIVQT